MAVKPKGKYSDASQPLRNSRCSTIHVKLIFKRKTQRAHYLSKSAEGLRIHILGSYEGLRDLRIVVHSLKTKQPLLPKALSSGP